jgi:putative IMPACT (imprinted ancient) family translation regulator
MKTEKGEITTNTKEIQGIIRDYFENLYSNKLENLEEMDKFLNTYNHLKFNQEDINHINRSITSNEIEAAIVTQKRKVQNLTDSLLNSIRPLKRTDTNTP